MSFKRHVLASYVSQIYTTLIGIVIVPVYIKYMGAEAYGLIGFYAMLQAWFQLLDMGLAPTISRETARFNGGAIDVQTLRKLLRALECIFYGVALVGSVSLVLASDVIATQWLKVEHLPLSQVRGSVELMAGIIGLRWIAGLYRGAIGGFEQQVWLGKLNVLMATARFVAVIAIFELIGTSPLHFFAYQLCVGVVETGVLALKTYNLMPRLPQGIKNTLTLRPLLGVMKFSLGVAFTSSVWVFVTQTDKLILSKLLPLSEYAYFTLGVLVASGVNVMSGPISGALMPRLSRMTAQGNELGVIALYRKSTQFVAILAVSVTVTLFFYADSLLFAWTGSLDTVEHAAPILRLYAVGNCLLALVAFPYYLQFAKGDVRLHIIGNAIYALLLIPSVVGATYVYGAIGAGWAWIVANSIYFFAWVPVVHRRFVRGLHLKWLFEDIFPIFFFTLAVSLVVKSFWVAPGDRVVTFAAIFAIGLMVFLSSSLASSQVREYLKNKFIKRPALND